MCHYSYNLKIFAVTLYFDHFLIKIKNRLEQKLSFFSLKS